MRGSLKTVETRTTAYLLIHKNQELGSYINPLFPLFFLVFKRNPKDTIYIKGSDAICRAILERQLNLKQERITESARRPVLHLPSKSRGLQDHIRNAAMVAADGGRQGGSGEGKQQRQVTRTAPAPGRAASQGPAPRAPPSASRTALPAPPHPAPSSLHERKWESQRRGPAETKHRGGRGGAAVGEKAPERRRPALPSSPAAALTRSGIGSRPCTRSRAN